MDKNKKKYFIDDELLRHVQALERRGGRFKKAADKVHVVVSKVASNSEDPLSGFKPTNHGESRIKGCVKYDLPGFCRLVTIQTENQIALLFVGDHDDTDKWLDSNRGYQLVCEEGRVQKLKISTPESGGRSGSIGAAVYSPGKLYEFIDVDDYDYIVDGVARSIARRLETLYCYSSEEEIREIVNDIEDQERSALIWDIFCDLKAGDVEAVKRRISFEKGDITPIEENSNVGSGPSIHEIPTDDPQYAEKFAHFVRSADYKEWMLFMHPDQQAMVDADFDGPAKLLGVSGSGKTCVVVMRAVRLAEKYADEKVLVVTLNRSLALLIRELVQEVAIGAVADRIEVKPLFEVCQSYLHRLEPGSDKLYDDKTWKSNEHIDEIWTEFYRCELNNHDASVLYPVHDYLTSSGIWAEDYIREEFDWIRSAVPASDRKAYLKMEREGRSVPMQRQFRQLILEGLGAWERKMIAVGVTDYLGLATALTRYDAKLGPDYRCTIVDESQDFGTSEMAIIRKITKTGENDLLVCGDAAQRVSTKFQSLRRSGINIASTRSKKIMKNYRNSREILTAAYNILLNNLSDEVMGSEDFELLDPEYSNFSASVPLLLNAPDLEMEVAAAFQFARDELRENENWKVCIAFCGFSLHEIQNYAKPLKGRVLDGSTSLADGTLFFSDLEQTKGFEFDLVIVVNASAGVLPKFDSPEKEQYRDLTQFYVAMTRAKSELVVSYNGEASPLLKGCSEYLLEASWESYLEDEIEPIKAPDKLDVFRDNGHVRKSVLFMSGAEFLYTRAALGQSAFLIQKLRDRISGRSVITGRSYTQWRNIGSAYHSVQTDVKSRQAFGPKGTEEFRALCESLDVVGQLEFVPRMQLFEVSE